MNPELKKMVIYEKIKMLGEIKGVVDDDIYESFKARTVEDIYEFFDKDNATKMKKLAEVCSGQ